MVQGVQAPNFYGLPGRRSPLGAIGEVADLSVFSIQDDYRWMFWYFGLHPSEFPNYVQYAIVLIQGR